ncbi:glycosyltransferase [Corynebacterium vitaeruminis]|uniref:Group 1 glycosyl transferase n=1 Tax=Corynebacterium vitaeruminis DSM 20294 TaxID=1224164 RepID=W5Y2Y1_9CORY|nr:glycosyltransferase [Corynebacterium vitaeruminis]AHI23264.1 group 1 glycosyl transferase [Corynebacterium vitaeruminis DSM 20294]
MGNSSKVLWVHWGRTGGGPRFLYELAKGDLQVSEPGSQFISFNPDAEIAGRLRELPVPSLHVKTYQSKIGVVLGLPRLIWNSVRLRLWIRRNKIQVVVGVMESVYQSLAVPLCIPQSVHYIAGIHDGQHHPGESSLVQQLGRHLELWRADQVLTFSNEVASIVGQQTAVPIIVAEHPPFGITAQSIITPRAFPENRPVVIGLFGRLQEYKGIGLLLEAARLLRSDPEFKNLPEFEIRIVGNGPCAKLQNSTNGQEASWDIRWIPESEVDNIVSSFDIMVLPYTEASQSGPLGLALAQAIPCVVTPQGALPAQAEDFGVVAENMTPIAFARAISKVISTSVAYEVLSMCAVNKLANSPMWKGLAGQVRKEALKG